MATARGSAIWNMQPAMDGAPDPRGCRAFSDAARSAASARAAWRRRTRRGPRHSGGPRRRRRFQEIREPAAVLLVSSSGSMIWRLGHDITVRNVPRMPSSASVSVWERASGGDPAKPPRRASSLLPVSRPWRTSRWRVSAWRRGAQACSSMTPDGRGAGALPAGP